MADMPNSMAEISKSTNGMVDCLAKRGVNQSCNLSAPVM